MASINTYNNTYPYQGIKLVKVSKIDKEGKDITYRLLNLQTLTLSLGSSFQTYEITQRQEFDTYFLFNIDNENYDTSYTGSRVEEIYKRHDYGFSISRADTNYNPVDKFLQPTPNKYVNAFGNNSSIGDYANYPVTILIDSNGPDNESYFGKYLGIDQPQKLFFWSNTPSVPMKYTTSIRVTSTKRYEFTVAMIKASNTSDSNGSGLINQSADTNIIPSIVTVTNPSNFSDLTPEDQATISDSPLTIDIGPPINSKIIQLEGVTDVHQGQYTTVIFKFNTTDDDPVWDPSAVSIESLNFTINPYYEIEEDGTMATFPQEGNTSLLSTQPNLFIEDTANLDVYEFSDYNPTLNNAFVTKKSQFIQKSIRDKNSLEPSNLPLILNGLAEPSDVSDYNYELNASADARYNGSKNTSANFNLNSKDGLGLPPAEFGSIYFLNCIGAGGQYPEVIGSTAFFFNTLIDQNSNVYQALDDSVPQFTDLKHTFAPGINVDINIVAKNREFIGYDGLSGVSKIVGFGELQTLLNTGTGSLPLDYVNALDFEFDSTDSQESVDDYRLTSTLTSDVNYTTLEGNNNRIAWNSTIFEAPSDAGYSYNSGTGIYEFDPLNGAAETNAFVKFKAIVKIVNTGASSDNGLFDTSATIKLKKNNETLASQTISLPGMGTSYNSEDITSVTLESNLQNFADQDEIFVQVIGEGTVNTNNAILVKNNSSLEVTQNPSPTNEVTEGVFMTPTTDFGETGYTFQPTSILMFSPGISANLGYKQILSSSQEDFGYTQGIVVPFNPEPGDQIRIGFNEEQSYTITKVVLPQETSANRLYVQINGKVENLGNARNHFLIRRFNGRATQLTTNRNKSFANSGDGTTTLSSITPVDKSTALKNNLTTIIRNLTNEGIL